MARATIAPFLLPVLLASCGGGVRSLEGAAFGTTWTVKYVGEPAVEEVQRVVERELAAYDRIFSTYRDDSQVSAFNAYRSFDTFACGPELREVVRLAQDIANWTRGAFDPTIKPMRDVYDTWGGGAMPDPAAMERARQRVGWGKLLVTDMGLRKAFKDLELDLNAIAKGAAVDRVGAVLSELGIERWFVEIGGEVRCRGTKPGDDPWRVGVADPNRPRSARVAVSLRDAAMATSGTYLNEVRAGEETWHHVLDPRTGRNADNGVVSVSVVASSCALADGLATALMVLGPEGGKPVLDHYDDEGAGALFLVRGPDGDLQEVKVQWPW